MASGAFAEAYPLLTRWITTQGWIEIGLDPMLPSLVRVLDEGGLVWEGGEGEERVDDVLAAAEVAIRDRDVWP